MHVGPKKHVEQESDTYFGLSWAKKKKKKRFFVPKTAIFPKKMVSNEIFLSFFLQKHKVPIVIDIWVNLEQFWIGLWGSKIALKCSKVEKWPKNWKIVKADVLEQFLRVKYTVSMSFIDLLKKHGRDKRKPQNRNMQMRSKCDFFKK